MKKNLYKIKVLLQVCFLCPTILHQPPIKKKSHAQAAIYHTRKYGEVGTCKKTEPEHSKNTKKNNKSSDLTKKGK